MKKKLTWFILSFFIVASLLLVSCGTAEVAEEEEEEEEVGEEVPQHGGIINLVARFGLTGAYARFDPLGASANLNDHSYESLLYGDYYVTEEEWAFDSPYFPLEHMAGWLAESWEQNDPQTFTFKLREGVKWWDKAPANGRELVAEDVKWFYEEFLERDLTDKGDLIYIDSINCPDRYTIVFHTSIPFTSEGLKLFCGSARTEGLVCCPDVIEAYGDDGYVQWENALGTGAWMITDYLEGATATFERNPNYWDYDQNYPDNQLPYADGLIYTSVTDASTQLAALRTGKLDYHRSVTWQEVETLAASNPELQKRELIGTPNMIFMHCQKEPFTDVRVRQALQMALNVEEMARDFFKGNAVVGIDNWPFFISWTGWNTPYDEMPQQIQDIYTYDPEGAEALLDIAGYPRDPATGIRFETEVLIDAPGADEMAIAKEYFADIGVEMEIKVLERGVYQGLGSSHDYDQMMGFVINGNLQVSPERVFEWLKPGRTARHEWRDEDWIARLDAAYGIMDDDVRQAELKDLANEALEQVPMLLMCSTFNYYYWQPWLKGYRGIHSLTGNEATMYKYWWLDLDLKESIIGER